MAGLRLALAVALAGAAAGGTAYAADVVTVGREARTGLELVVYGRNAGAVVQDARRIRLPGGAVTLRFLDVPPQLDPRTVALRARTGDLRVRTQGFRFDLGSPDLLLSRWIGREVELVETDRDLRTQVTPATLLAVQPTRIFRIGDQIVLDHPGRIRLPLGEITPVLEPMLTFTVGSDGAGERVVEASYETGGLGWEADYALTIAADERQADLAGWVTLVNDSAAAYEEAAVAVVAGDVHQVREEPRPMARMLAAEAAGAAPDADVTETQPFEYHRYDLPGRITLMPGETTQVRLLSARAVPIEKRWVVEAQGGWYRSAVDDVEQPLPVQARLAFQNEGPGDLGRLLPAGIVRVHARGDEGRTTFAGEDRIGHVAEGERVRLMVGRATDVVATRRQTAWERISVKPYDFETAAEVRLRNRKQRPVTVEVRETIGGTWQVVESSHPAQRLDANTLGFEVEVPAGGETVVTYRLQVGR